MRHVEPFVAPLQLSLFALDRREILHVLSPRQYAFEVVDDTLHCEPKTLYEFEAPAAEHTFVAPPQPTYFVDSVRDTFVSPEKED